MVRGSRDPKPDPEAKAELRGGDAGWGKERLHSPHAKGGLMLSTNPSMSLGDDRLRQPMDTIYAKMKEEKNQSNAGMN